MSRCAYSVINLKITISCEPWLLTSAVLQSRWINVNATSSSTKSNLSYLYRLDRGFRAAVDSQRFLKEDCNLRLRGYFRKHLTDSCMNIS
jgi:hypothetical protein